MVLEPLGRSDCVEKELLVTLPTDSMSLSKSTRPSGSLSLSRSGDSDLLVLVCVVRSLSLKPLYLLSQFEPVLLYVWTYLILCPLDDLSSRSWATRSWRARAKACGTWGSCLFFGEPVGVAVADLDWKREVLYPVPVVGW